MNTRLTCLVGVGGEGGRQDLPSLSILVVNGSIIIIVFVVRGRADLALHQSLNSSLVGLPDLLELGLDRRTCQSQKQTAVSRFDHLLLRSMSAWVRPHHAEVQVPRWSWSFLLVRPPTVQRRLRPASPSPSVVGVVTFHPEPPDSGHAPFPAVARPAPWQLPLKLYRWTLRRHVTPFLINFSTKTWCFKINSETNGQFFFEDTSRTRIRL